MCGILGVSLYGTLTKTRERIRQEVALFMATEILMRSKVRGKDSTGLAALFEDSSFVGLKMPIDAEEFVSRFGDDETYYDGYLNLLRSTSKSGQNMKMIIGHARKSSVGSLTNANNIHPIKVNNIVGVHNGTLKNHDVIFKKLNCGRDGTVDSEAIIRLMHYYTDRGRQPWTSENLIEVAKRLDGTFAFLAFNANNPWQLAGCRDQRPMELAWIKPLQMMVIASEKKFIEEALHRHNMMVNNYGNPFKTKMIGKDDVEFKFIPDKTLIIFNLLSKVKADTKIDDLYTDGKLPSYNQKIWSSQYSYSDYGSHAGRASASVASEDKKKSSSADSSTNGRSWNRKIGKYTSAKEKATLVAKESGNVEVSKSDVKGLDTTDILKNVDITEVHSAGAQDHSKVIKTEKAKIINLSNADHIRDQIIEVEDIFDEVNEIDMAVDVELEKEAQAAADNIERFCNNNDIVIGLDFENEDTVINMAPSSLVNRARIKAFKQGYIECAKTRSGKDSKTGPNYANKLAAGEKNIKFLKSIAGIMSVIMTKINVSSQEALKRILEQAVVEAKKRNKEISLSLFDIVFTAGDCRNNTGLKMLRETILSKGN